EQAIVERRPRDLDTLCEHEAALELARGDPAVQIDPLLVLLLPAADDQLAIFDLNLQVLPRESGNCQRDAQAGFADLLDVIGRITFRRGLRDPVERTLEMVESQKKWAIEEGK